jgi:hypothetical protein
MFCFSQIASEQMVLLEEKAAASNQNGKKPDHQSYRSENRTP